MGTPGKEGSLAREVAIDTAYQQKDKHDDEGDCRIMSDVVLES